MKMSVGGKLHRSAEKNKRESPGEGVRVCGEATIG